MKQEQKMRIRYGQNLAPVEKKSLRKDEVEAQTDDSAFNEEMAKAFAEMTTRVEKKIESAVADLKVDSPSFDGEKMKDQLKDYVEDYINERVEKEVGKLLGESMSEKVVVDSEVNVIATAALQEEVKADLEKTEAEEKIEEVVEKAVKGKK